MYIYNYLIIYTEHSSIKKQRLQRRYWLLGSRALFYNFIRMMEKLNLAYSTKNIPIPTERNHKLQFIEKLSYLSRNSVGI